jgi:hypothetical protein
VPFCSFAYWDRTICGVVGYDAARGRAGKVCGHTLCDADRAMRTDSWNTKLLAQLLLQIGRCGRRRSDLENYFTSE